MKTEVKFRELPEKVRGFVHKLDRQNLSNYYDEWDDISLNWLHSKADWTKATNDERLAYAEWRYRDGVKYRPIRANCEIVSKGLFCLHSDGVIHESDKNKNSIQFDNLTYALIYDGKEWAELVSEPEELIPNKFENKEVINAFKEIPDLSQKQSIKDRLKGTCVNSESVEMGAEIVELYENGGIINHYGHTGVEIYSYYGELNGMLVCSTDPKCFDKILTKDQLRQIVRGQEKPLFKVGDRPKWTPELIKQLPHGTALRCAYTRNKFTFNGEETKEGGNKSIYIEKAFDRMFFYSQFIEEYAEILSLPDIKEASPSAQQEFVKANPGMQHIEEPKAGDMVEARIDGWPDGTWRDRKYLCKNSFGKFVCEYKDGSVERFDEIRLPQKSEVESKAKEIVKYYNSPVSTEFYNPGEEREKQIALTAIKWGQANPGKI